MHVCTYEYMGTCVCATNMHVHMDRCAHVFMCVGRAEVDIKNFAQCVLPGLLRHFLSLHVELIGSMALVSQRASGICQSLCHSSTGVAGTFCHISFLMNDGNLNRGPHSVHICFWPRALSGRLPQAYSLSLHGKNSISRNAVC